ncbi:IS1595 family transposase [uncultured Sphaerochaeta sp.]|uniref:IS1595 family transposase n=1 Tax=uncultured Sphaerochaeta sp. TaxID=886478 RepID=UPI002A0A3FF9|nr:IS1595 family transposase [uncultured Sphaerochaeta sp.]
MNETSAENKEKIEAFVAYIESLETNEERNAVIDEINDQLKKKETKTIARYPVQTGTTLILESDGPHCPHCGSSHVVSNGSVKGKRRYVCKDCNRSFGKTTGTLSYANKSGNDTWIAFLEGMLKGNTLEQLALKCSISLGTAHIWRHKLFRQLMNSQEGTSLKGIVQEDEYYVTASFKGNKGATKNLNSNRESKQTEPDYAIYDFPGHPRRRGRASELKEFGAEGICVATAIDQDQTVIGKPAARGKLKANAMTGFFDGKLSEGIILVTDKKKGGKIFAEQNQIAHVILDQNKETSYGTTYNRQQIKSIHLQINKLCHSRRSFATKYCEGYVTWIAWNTIMKDKPIQEKVDILNNLVTVGKSTPSRADISNTPFPTELRQKQ